MLTEWEVGFGSMDMATNVVLALTNTVWWMSPFYEKFQSRACNIPKAMIQFANARDIIYQHVKKPTVRIHCTSFSK